MELTILGSSSKGNCYVIQDENEALVIECGVPFNEVKKAVDFNVKKIAGAIMTHEHFDHSRAVNDFLHYRIPVYASHGTVNNLKLKETFLPLLIEAGVKIKVGNFEILPFDVKHDCAEPLGFVIKHEKTGNILFATDTYFVPYTFANLNNILIEANYRMDLLQKNISAGRIPKVLMDRTLESHMSLDTCREALLANDLSKVNNIVLLHLSDGNSHAEEFQMDIKSATGKTVHIADAGLKIKLSKTPF
jgi:phosphoribosyl 1,2-cyclic phosphodiesterase